MPRLESLQLGDAVGFLERSGGISEAHRLEMCLAYWDDPDLEGEFRDDYHEEEDDDWAPWKHINGSGFQFEVGFSNLRR